MAQFDVHRNPAPSRTRVPFLLDVQADLLKVLATSMCGTDSHIYRWDAWAQGRIHPPRILGLPGLDARLPHGPCHSAGPPPDSLCAIPGRPSVRHRSS